MKIDPSLPIPTTFFWGGAPLSSLRPLCDVKWQCSLFCTGSSLLCWLSLCCCWHPWHFQVHFNSPIPISGDGGAAAADCFVPKTRPPILPSFHHGISQKKIPVFTFLTHPSTQNPFSVEHRKSVACVSHPLLHILEVSNVWFVSDGYLFFRLQMINPLLHTTSCDQMSWADARGHQITKCRSFHWGRRRRRFFSLSPLLLMTRWVVKTFCPFIIRWWH